MQAQLRKGRTLQQESVRLNRPLAELKQATGIDDVHRPLATSLVLQLPDSPATHAKSAARSLSNDPGRADASSGPNAKAGLWAHDLHTQMDQDALGRPLAKMKLAPDVLHFDAAEERPLGRGLFLTEMSNSPRDPAVSIDYVRAAAGSAATFDGRDGDARLVVLEGSASVFIDGRRVAAKPGDVIVAPEGTALKVSAAAGQDLRLACVFTPRKRWPGAEEERTALPTWMETRPGVQRFDPQDEYRIREGCFITAVANLESDPSASVSQARVVPGVTTALHTLPDVDERLVITQGEGMMQIGDRLEKVKAGDVVLIPKGTPQRITAQGGKDLLFWCVCTPRFMKERDYAHLEDAKGP